ncbi:hypothetical protein PF005_g10911 [Phytophthora fragariae]|uniref:Uncharacterized protein n=1 Tax=Phytophthora fragariae TaxID=53985 RepID=A0A6A4A653_9STRA|nr:hypothetical protein PF003_g4333 [Phytophthora fragariae]KAE8943368.1 hypothetical protein PF009_g6905 [Phytophthora fragariae]KAE9001317.1 hypothetical protein PF011_g13791 [Phytophthora fragariae]KAE9111942.1 hypothetical protein PF010_g10628 [Phytophthora fragariae]KAE9112395.1 hypothetical protein PF007_g11118 [Phytophthora fragariae]
MEALAGLIAQAVPADMRGHLVAITTDARNAISAAAISHLVNDAAEANDALMEARRTLYPASGILGSISWRRTPARRKSTMTTPSCCQSPIIEQDAKFLVVGWRPRRQVSTRRQVQLRALVMARLESAAAPPAMLSSPSARRATPSSPRVRFADPPASPALSSTSSVSTLALSPSPRRLSKKAKRVAAAQKAAATRKKNKASKDEATAARTAPSTPKSSPTCQGRGLHSPRSLMGLMDDSDARAAALRVAVATRSIAPPQCTGYVPPPPPMNAADPGKNRKRGAAQT